MLSYGADLQPSAVRDGYGNSYLFYYDDGGKLKYVSDQTGRLLRFCYEDDKIAEIKDPEGRLSKFIYDQNGWLIGLKDGRGVICLQNTFDSTKRTVRQEVPDGGVVNYEYLDDVNQVRMMEQNGNVIVYERDEFYRTVRNIYENGNPISFKNALGDELQYTYTSLNQIQSVAMNGTVLYHAAYNDRNLQETVEDAMGGRNSYEYDRLRRLVKVTDPVGRLIVFSMMYAVI